MLTAINSSFSVKFKITKINSMIDSTLMGILSTASVMGIILSIKQHAQQDVGMGDL